MKIIGVIPARYGSTRFPGKVLADINGKPMIQHVYEKSKKSKYLKRVLVATDDEKVLEAVRNFGGEVIMTSKEHKSGTDRIAEAVENEDVDIVVNVQGDEPLINPLAINAAIAPFLEDDSLVMSTLKKKAEEKDLQDPNVVKVATDKKDFALYFSRYGIPFCRNEGRVYKHIGLYVYRKDFLLKFSKLAQTELEKTESLEQLRALENGFKIKVVEVDYDSIGVDTQEDLQKVIEIENKQF